MTDLSDRPRVANRIAATPRRCFDGAVSVERGFSGTPARERLTRRSLLTFDNQLTARGADVAAAALADRDCHVAVGQNLRELVDHARPTDARMESPRPAFSGIRLTFALMPDSSRASRRASSGESFTPASITYSNVMRLRFFSGKRLHASMMSASGISG